MTLVVAWFRERFGNLWVAADTRISANPFVLTEHGPKIFQIPVVCRKILRHGETSRIYRTNYGFAYSGSTVSALGVHALASACCQNLSSERKIDPPSVEDVARLYRKLAEIQVMEMCSHLAPHKWQSTFFYAFVFGFCLLKKRLQLWVIEMGFAENALKASVRELPPSPGIYYPIGSGTEEFNRLIDEEAAKNSGWGVSYVLDKMIRGATDPTVGGYMQIGIADATGVTLPPLLVPGDAAPSANITFLGVPVDTLGNVGGFTIGYHAIGPDEQELAERAAKT
jgi:hypothetical protein